MLRRGADGALDAGTPAGRLALSSLNRVVVTKKRLTAASTTALAQVAATPAATPAEDEDFAAAADALGDVTAAAFFPTDIIRPLGGALVIPIARHPSVLLAIGVDDRGPDDRVVKLVLVHTAPSDAREDADTGARRCPARPFRRCPDSASAMSSRRCRFGPTARSLSAARLGRARIQGSSARCSREETFRPSSGGVSRESPKTSSTRAQNSECMPSANLSRLTDEELAPCAPEDHRCLEILLERYQEKVRACAWKMVGDPNEVEDLTQEALLRLIRSLPGFRARSSFATWVYQIAHNTCVDAYRRRSRMPVAAVQLEDQEGELSLPEQLVADGTDPEVLLEDAIAECYLEQALRELPEDYARIATLRLIDGWSNEEIAAGLGISRDAAKGKLKRARAG